MGMRLFATGESKVSTVIRCRKQIRARPHLALILPGHFLTTTHWLVEAERACDHFLIG